MAYLWFTAALFEVIGRYAVAKLMRKNLTFQRGIAAGIGHGGIEAITVVGAVKDSLLHMHSGMFLLAGYERILTMMLQVALSLIVCYYVSKGEDWKGIIICLLCHCAVDFIIPLVNGCATEYMGNLMSATTASIIVYVLLTVVAVASALAIRNLKKNFGKRIS